MKKEIFFYQSDREAWEFFSSYDWMHYKDLGRNDLCKCGKGKKYKNCCMSKVDICLRMYSDIEQNMYDYKVHKDALIEKGIAEFYVSEEPPNN